MKSVEESVVVTAMDGSDPALFRYLPYILQDSWELGSDPKALVAVVKKYAPARECLTVLDLGCGKGAVSVLIAKETGAHCHGIDAVPDFIRTADEMAKKHAVADLCKFEVGDIRVVLSSLSKYDVIILGSIGQVLGEPRTAFLQLKEHITDDGIIIYDDGYMDDDSEFQHELILKKSEVFRQLEQAGLKVVDEVFSEHDDLSENQESLQDNLIKRCRELIVQYPEQKSLFEDYIKKQEDEVDVLVNKTVCATMILKKSPADHES